ncbi:MAG TPA: nitroreductase family protein, partial [Polyangiaceae bacterium]|nr:nitroreductase family protein [Polyangiaceae bacterium]
VQSRLSSEGSPASPCDTSELASYTKNFLAFGHAPCVVAVVFRATNVLRCAVSPQAALDELSSVREGLCSASAFIMQLLLAAHAEGLGACWMTGPCIAEQELLALLEIPQGWRLAGLVPLGHVQSRSVAPRRRRVDQLRLQEPAHAEVRHDAVSISSSQPGGSGCASS